MNKQEMISTISTKVGGSKKDAGIYLDAVVETITETLAKHEKIALVGFGTFEARHRDARIARNPQDGTEIQVPEMYVPAFKAGAKLKDAVRNA